MADEIRPAGVGIKLRTAPRHMARWIITSLFVVVFAVFGGVVWMALGEIGSLNREPLVVRAPPGPIKQPPEERGGLAVLNEGSPLVRSLDNFDDRPGPERILPPEEAPPRSAAQALPVQPEGTAGIELVQRRDADVEPAGGPIEPSEAGRIPPVRALHSPEPIAPVVTTTAPVEAVEPEEPQVAALAPSATTEQPPPDPVPATESRPQIRPDSAVAVGDYRLQLLALRDLNSVRRAWAQFQDRFDPLFDDVAARVVGVDTDNGRFYRLQVGPFRGREAALSVCEEVKSKGGDCFVVGPFS